MPQWIRAGTVNELQQRKVLTVTVDGERIAVFFTEHGLFALEDRCPHRGGRLSEGLLYEPCKLACPDHGWGIDLQTGRVEPPERGAVHTFDVKVEEGDVWVQTG